MAAYFKREQERYVKDTAKFLYEYQELDDVMEQIIGEIKNEE